MIVKLIALYYVMAVVVALTHRKQLKAYLEEDALFVFITFWFSWPLYLLWFMAKPPEPLKD